MGNLYYSEHYSTFASPKDQAGTFVNKESEGTRRKDENHRDIHRPQERIRA